MKGFIAALAVLLLTVTAVVISGVAVQDFFDNAEESIRTAGDEASVRAAEVLEEASKSIKKKQPLMGYIMDERHITELTSLLDDAIACCYEERDAAYTAKREELFTLIKRLRRDFEYDPL